ncbi:MAG: hypothetical protein K2X08_07005 [Chlamydiales bacterium]|nr:hypothetical protein [Chlamydiales bacterium]
MKSKILILFFVIAPLMNIYGTCPTNIETITTQPNKTPDISIFEQTPPLLEIKTSYFFFVSSQINEVYRNGGIQVQLSSSYPIWKGLQLYGSTGFSEAWGRSQSFHQNTSLWQLSVDIGLKPIFTIASFAQYYFSIGPRYFYAHQHNNSSYVNKVIVKNGVGLFVNTGFNFYLMSHLIIDIFGEYAYEPAHFSPSRVNVYGRSTQLSYFSFGTGISYAF